MGTLLCAVFSNDRAKIIFTFDVRSSGFKVIFRRSLSLKSKLQTNLCKSDSTCRVVYKITCSCCKKYVGETGRTIEERIKEHQADVNNKRSVEKITGLSQHLRESRHTPNWKEIEILARENNIVKRKFKESVAISQKKKDNLLNKKEERKVISDIWSAIIFSAITSLLFFIDK